MSSRGRDRGRDRGRGRVWGSSRRGRVRGRGHEGDDEECAQYLKKVQPATLGDAFSKSSSSPSSSGGQSARSPTQPTCAAMPSSQPGWGSGSGRGRGRGRGREGEVDEGAPESKKGRQATLPEHAWPALPSSSSSSQPSPPQSQVQTQLMSDADTADSKQGLLSEVKLVQERPVNRSLPSWSLAQIGVVTLSSQPGGNATVADSDQERLHGGKRVQDSPQLSTKNTPSPSSAGSMPGFTPPRENITRQPTTSSGSDGTPPLNQSMNNAESLKLSYIGVFEKGSDPEKRERLSSKLLKFLNEFTEDGGAFPYYRAELLAIKLRSPFRLTLEFKHMVKHDIDLAFETWKCQGNMKDWLLPAVRDFLILEKYGNDDEIISKTRLVLSGFPSSIKKVADVLNNATYSLDLLGGECRVSEAKAEGKLVIHLFFTATFARHSKDLSWDGNFSVSDMFLVNNSELYICRPCVVATGLSRLRDIQKGGKELLPYFKGPAGYPAYFTQLEEDIDETNIKQIVEPWCAEYFIFHMASMPSMSRRSFELALHYISKNLAIEVQDIFTRLSTEANTDWQEYIVTSGCKLLKQVLDFIDPVTGHKVVYENNIGGLVRYKRHFLEHALFRGLFDVNEMELFGAKQFQKHLPGAVKLLLQKKKMVKCFGAAWSSLKSSRFDGRDTPAKQ